MPSVQANEELVLADDAERGYPLPPEMRLRQQRDFDRVYAESLHAADDILVVLARRNGLAWSRIGLAISRKVGTAVKRNRWKRLIREAFRLQQHDLPGGLDLVIRPRRGAEPEFRAISNSLAKLTKRLDRNLPPLTMEDGHSADGQEP